MKSKNYILLFVIYIFTILCVLYFCKIYRNSSSLRGASIDSYVLDVTGSSYDELYNNILNFSEENNSFVIYISSYKKDCSSFENMLVNIIKESNLKNKILFINSDDLLSFNYVNKLIDSFSEDSDVSFGELPIFVIIKDGNVFSIVSVINFDEATLRNVLGDVYD